MSQAPSTSLDRGFHGEQAMGFFLGERGFYFVNGPSGAGGHAANARGFDGVAYNPTTDRLIIYDNKSLKAPGNVSSATAIDANLATNLKALIVHTKGLTGLPNQARIVQLLQQAQTAVGGGKSGAAWPANVELAVSNAGGQSTGVSDKLANKNIRFINYYQAPAPVSRFRKMMGNQSVAAFLGDALGAALQAIGDIGIQMNIRRKLENELAPSIQAILERGEGVLVIIRLQQWTQPDFNGRRVRMLSSVLVSSGATKQEAIWSWQSTPRLTAGPPAGWSTVESYGWIAPLK